MKRTLALLLAILMLLSLTACDKDTKETGDRDDEQINIGDYKSDSRESEDLPEDEEASGETTETEVEPTEEVTQAEETELVDGLRPEFKEAMDAYEAFYVEYCDFMKKYMEDPTDLSLLAEYADIMEQAAEVDAAFEKWEDEELNDEELKYYLEVSNRVVQMLLDVMG